MKRFLSWMRNKFLQLSMRNRVSLIVIVGVLLYALFSSGKSESAPAIKTDNALEDRIQQVNMNQGKLCLLKMNAKTCAYVVDKATRWDMTPYEVWYTYDGEVDVIIDLTCTEVKIDGDMVIVTAPEPQIDRDTCNIRPHNLKQVGCKKGLRTEAMRAAVNQRAMDEVKEDLETTVAANLPMNEAKRQARSILMAMYNAAGCNNVRIEFYASHPDIR